MALWLLLARFPSCPGGPVRGQSRPQLKRGQPAQPSVDLQPAARSQRPGGTDPAPWSDHLTPASFPPGSAGRGLFGQEQLGRLQWGPLRHGHPSGSPAAGPRQPPLARGQHCCERRHQPRAPVSGRRLAGPGTGARPPPRRAGPGLRPQQLQQPAGTRPDSRSRAGAELHLQPECQPVAATSAAVGAQPGWIGPGR